jgi:hypothetical protein
MESLSIPVITALVQLGPLSEPDHLGIPPGEPPKDCLASKMPLELCNTSSLWMTSLLSEVPVCLWTSRRVSRVLESSQTSVYSLGGTALSPDETPRTKLSWMKDRSVFNASGRIPNMHAPLNVMPGGTSVGYAVSTAYRHD